jgi:hypothetical protein
LIIRSAVESVMGNLITGGNLKETGTTDWNFPIVGATNEVGYTALPGGYRNNNRLFNIWAAEICTRICALK